MHSESELIDTIKRLIDCLNTSGFKYHLTGGLVSSYYGEPRLTQDIDLVINIKPSNYKEIINALTGIFLFDEINIQEEIESKGLFQALDEKSLIKVDFHVSETIPGEFLRTKSIEILPSVIAPITSKSDIILIKLLWVLQGSEKSRQDLKGLLTDSKDIDYALIEEISKEMGTRKIWEEFKK